MIAKKMQVFSLSFCHKCMNNGLLIIEKHRLLFEKKAKQQKQSKTKELI